MRGIYAEVKDLMRIRGYAHYSNAWDAYEVIKKSYGKTGKQRLTIMQLCEYEGITIHDFMTSLHQNNNYILQHAG